MKLSRRALDWSDEQLKGVYVSGLTTDLRDNVLIHHLANLNATKRLARAFDNHRKSTRTQPRPFPTCFSPSSGSRPPGLPPASAPPSIGTFLTNHSRRPLPMKLYMAYPRLSPATRSLNLLSPSTRSQALLVQVQCAFRDPLANWASRFSLIRAPPTIC
ncbi:hypothetical protein Pyn_38864 [Prunus yedoensis var. nudiflora]|uniref:Uncharacterized protein n=1 Tax=Prunus yedoensis var. nudiflora TaxID=2094558 RepID=A0A315AUQ8_PRUYE|nr:hypothetical protein Pyn_38864 [Prunus yedoensis var. nudiflora]